MNTNFTEIKAGFQTYLENLYGKAETTNSSGEASFNLFDYNEELKDYLFSELNIDPDSLEGSLSEILDKALVENLYGNNQNAVSNNEFITGYLFDLLKDEDFAKVIDLNGDSKLDNNEIKEFMEYISLNDKDAENISYDDIYNGVNQVRNGEYIQAQLEQGNTTQAVADNIMETLEDINTASNNQTVTQTTAGTPVSAAGGGGGTGSGSSGDDNGEEIWVSGQTSLAGKTMEELQEMKVEKEEKASEERSKLNALYNGTDATVKNKEANVERAYELYMRRLEEEKVDTAKLKEMITQIDEQESKIDAQEVKISDKEADISKKEDAYDSAVSRRENLESALSALQSASSDDPEEQAAIDAQIAAVQAELSAAKTAEKAAYDALETAKAELTTLESEKDDMETELANLNAEKEAFEATVLETIGPNIAEAMNGYNNAKKDLETYKTNAAESARARIEAAEDDVSEIEKVITDNQNRSDTVEYSPNILGKSIVQEALKYLGWNEANGKADEFLYKWHSSSAQTGWCAAFVSYVMEQVSKNPELEAMGLSVPDWYTEIENQYWQVNVHRAAEKAGAIIEADQAQLGDIVLYDYDGDGTMQHIGIVYAIENGIMYTIEGNSGNTVKVNEYDLNHPKNQNITFVSVSGK